MLLTIREFQEVDDTVKSDRTYTEDISDERSLIVIEKLFDQYDIEHIFFDKKENIIRYSRSDPTSMAELSVNFPSKYSNKVEKFYVMRQYTDLRKRMKSLKSERKKLKDKIRQLKKT